MHLIHLLYTCRHAKQFPEIIDSNYSTYLTCDLRKGFETCCLALIACLYCLLSMTVYTVCWLYNKLYIVIFIADDAIIFCT